MAKKWQIMPKISSDFKKQFPEQNETVLQLLKNRGLIEPQEIEAFLSADYEKYSHDPFLFTDMERAVALTISHIKAGNKIVIYGDYDADGVTSSAILWSVLTSLHAKAEVYIPNRVTEGYGLNIPAIDEIISSGVKLIITVDNGIRNKKEVEYIKKANVDVVITDHHVAPPDKNELPDSLIINPVLVDEKYPFKYLAGVGVAAKLALAIIMRSTLEQQVKAKLENKIMDLVAIGTIADCVTLLGENRVLVKKGLEVLNKTNRIGLKELFSVAKINNDKKLDSWNIGFQISPRLNAAGRMDHANTAYELLITKDKEEAEALARDLNNSNIDRQKITEEIVFEIIKSIDLESLASGKKIIIAVSPSIYDSAKEPWNEGIIGLVAGRISEKYYLPVLVITGNENEIKGSGRSIEEFNVIKAVESLNKNLEKYGGHAAACGFSIAGQNNLENFIKEITSLAGEQLSQMNLLPTLSIDAELDFALLDEQLVEQIENLAPFGEDNPKPVFLSREVNIVDIMNMGIDNKHIKLKLKTDNSRIRNAIGFGQAEMWKDFKIGDKIDIVYYLEINDFNGRREVQLKIVDIKAHNV